MVNLSDEHSEDDTSWDDFGNDHSDELESDWDEDILESSYLCFSKLHANKADAEVWVEAKKAEHPDYDNDVPDYFVYPDGRVDASIELSYTKFAENKSVVK